MTTVRDLFVEALAMKVRGVAWPEIRAYLISKGHDIGHSQIGDRQGANQYELIFETGEKIRFDGTDYHYDRRSTEVWTTEAMPQPANPSLPPLGWMRNSDETVRPITMDRQRRIFADINSGSIGPVGPPLTAAPTAPTAIHPLNTESLSLGADRIANTLSERSAEIREAARALSEAIKGQIEQLNASKPNDAENLRRQNDFVAFLKQIAAGLDRLADALDQAIACSSDGKPDPVFLGKAGEIAQSLSVAVTGGLERNRNYIVDCSIKFSVFAAGFVFLHACGVDGWIASCVAALMNLRKFE
jgi:hypothetical protein